METGWLNERRERATAQDIANNDYDRIIDNTVRLPKSYVTIDFFKNSFEKNEGKILKYIENIRSDTVVLVNGYDIEMDRSDMRFVMDREFANKSDPKESPLYKQFIVYQASVTNALKQLYGSKYKKAIEEGRAFHRVEAIFDKIRKEINKNPDFDLFTSDTLTEKELSFIARLTDNDYFAAFESFYAPMKMMFGAYTPVRSIESHMARSVGRNCVRQITDKIFGDDPRYDALEFNPNWTGMGMYYEDIKKWIDMISDAVKMYIKVVIKDRDCSEVKTIYSKNSKYKQKCITIHQHNNHADANKFDMLEVFNSHTKKDKKNRWATEPIYLTRPEMKQILVNYEGPKGIFANIINGQTTDAEIYAVWTNKNIYLQDTPLLDRTKDPYEISATRKYYNEVKKKFTPMTDNHKLREHFMHQARPVPCGVVCEGISLEHPSIKKIDINSAFKNFSRGLCTGKLIDIPSETVYNCDNSILYSKKISGHVFVKNIVPPVIIGSLEISKALFGCHDGLMTMVEARWFLDNGGDLEVVSCIPSIIIDDALTEYFEGFGKEEKRIVNCIIGKMSSMEDRKIDVTNDPDEELYLSSKYKDAGENPITVTIQDFDSDFGKTCFLVSHVNNDGRTVPQYQYLHNYIISGARIQLFNKLIQLHEAGCKIISVRTDAIAFIDNEKVPDILCHPGENDITWKWEEYKNNLVNLVKPKEHSAIIESEFEWDPVLSKKYISLEAPGGHGKTTWIKNHFDVDSVSILVPTHSAANLYIQCGYKYVDTISGFLIKLYRKGSGIIKPTIVIDEASMVGWTDLYKLRSQLIKATGKEWAGSTIVLSGDPAQLPPIEKKGNVYTSKMYKETFYKLTTANVFKKNYRSEGDIVEYLRELRKCTLNKEYDVANMLMKTIQHHDDVRVITEMEYHSDWTYIAHKNEVVDYINMNILDNIETNRWKVYTKNKKKIGSFFNNQQCIYNVRTNIIKNEYGEKINADDIEWQLGFASTTHKMQGQTVTGDVCIIINDIVSLNMLYTAISRVTSLKKLILYYGKVSQITGAQ